MSGDKGLSYWEEQPGRDERAIGILEVPNGYIVAQGTSIHHPRGDTESRVTYQLPIFHLIKVMPGYPLKIRTLEDGCCMEVRLNGEHGMFMGRAQANPKMWKQSALMVVPDILYQKSEGKEEGGVFSGWGNCLEFPERFRKVEGVILGEEYSEENQQKIHILKTKDDLGRGLGMGKHDGTQIVHPIPNGLVGNAVYLWLKGIREVTKFDVAVSSYDVFGFVDLSDVAREASWQITKAFQDEFEDRMFCNGSTQI